MKVRSWAFCWYWTNIRTGKSFSIPIALDVVAKGTRYSKEFGAFLKVLHPHT